MSQEGHPPTEEKPNRPGSSVTIDTTWLTCYKYQP